MRKILWLLLIASMAMSCSSGRETPVVLGAIYPTDGGQGSGGVEEYRGVQLATELANARGGVKGRSIELHLVPAASSDQAPGAVERLAAERVPLIIGSYGSTISRAIANTASAKGIMFWETGAVGLLDMQARNSDLVFRFSPTGESLGQAGVDFMRTTLLPRLHKDPSELRHGVVFVDDVYGRSVGEGMARTIRAAGLPFAGSFAYNLRSVDYGALAERLRRARVDVLYVSAYIDDGVALRREMVKRHIKLTASIGTSSSYCMPSFGAALGRDAVGLFASDKPDSDVLDPRDLTTEAGSVLTWARDRYRARFGGVMTAAALTGFAGAWGLFDDVLPAASSMRTADIVRAARAVDVPAGALPNGSGLSFGLGSPDNVRAASVIWEWVAPGKRAIVWPRAYATHPLLAVPIR